MAPSSAENGLPLGYIDPDAYVAQVHFNRTANMTTTMGNDANETVSMDMSYAIGGKHDDQDAPVLVWINGLGSHRLSIVILDGFCLEYGIKLITFDRPNSGLSRVDDDSGPIPLRSRVRVTYDMLSCILKQESVSECSILSHSNGVVYALFTMLQFMSSQTTSFNSDVQSRPRIKHWIMTSPWVTTNISGSMIGWAKLIPAQWTNQAGTVAKLATSVTSMFQGVSNGASSWFSSSSGWSSGLLASSGTMPAAGSFGSGTTPTATPVAVANLSPSKQRTNYVRSQSNKPQHKRMFPGLFVGPTVFQKSMNKAMLEPSAMGEEALLCLRKGDGVHWGWEDEDIDTDTDGQFMTAQQQEERLYRSSFSKLKGLFDELESRRDALAESQGSRQTRPNVPRVVLWQARDDGMVPERGREFLEQLLVEELNLVDDRDAHIVPDAGHDEILSLEFVMRAVLGMVAEREV
ncbi:hypothetical protein OIO90_005339 [Microbotryomycetes sp. JL221]|nr:hypothetical protein OIO90_005339 [Microbotryomycetes sp. JL221]